MRTLTVMESQVLHGASVRLKFERNRLDHEGNVSDPELARTLAVGLAALAAAMSAES